MAECGPYLIKWQGLLLCCLWAGRQGQAGTKCCSECSPTGPAKGIYDGPSITNSRSSSSPVRTIFLFHFFFFLTKLPGFPHSLACAFIPLSGSSIVLIERTFCQILQRLQVSWRNTVSAAVPQRCQQNKLKLKCVVFAPLESPLALQTAFPKPSCSPVSICHFLDTPVASSQENWSSFFL